MTIEFKECQHVHDAAALFRDLAKHDTVDKLLQACLDGTSAFGVITLGIAWDRTPHIIMDAARKSDDADAVMTKLKKLPKGRRQIPSDAMKITADAFEHQLLIELK